MIYDQFATKYGKIPPSFKSLGLLTLQAHNPVFTCCFLTAGTVNLYKCFSISVYRMNEVLNKKGESCAMSYRCRIMSHDHRRTFKVNETTLSHQFKRNYFGHNKMVLDVRLRFQN